MTYSKNAKYNKLVRDNIPKIIKEKDDLQVLTRTLNREEAIKELKKKIIEEGSELSQTTETKELKDELADLLEIIYALERELGYDREEIENLRNSKAEKRGGFEKRIFLIGTKEK